MAGQELDTVDQDTTGQENTTTHQEGVACCCKRIAALEGENTALRELLKARSQGRHIMHRNISQHWEAWELCSTYPCPEDRAALKEAT